MAWRDDLPRIKAENAAWKAEHGPRLRERDERRAREREQVSDIINRGLAAIGASSEERTLVFAKTGFGNAR